MKNLAITLYVLLHTTLCGCGKDKRQTETLIVTSAYEIEKVGSLSGGLIECSGFALAEDEETLWAHNDGGNNHELFRIDFKGKQVERKLVENTRNRDWEDITKDKAGHLYIGDFGNNNNARKDFTIYKIREKDLSLVGEINFTYPDQKYFPPSKKNRNFDCEAFVWRNDSLHLFSKDRGRRRMVKHYTVPDQPGQYQAVLTDSLKLNTMITGASVSPDGKTIAILGYGKIFLFEVDSDQPIYHGKRMCIAVPGSAQSEAIAFINNTDLIFANEQGKLYRARKK